MKDLKELYEFEKNNQITVGRLKEELRLYSDDTKITFGATINAIPLIFYRVKTRGDNLVQIELNEVTEELL